MLTGGVDERLAVKSTRRYGRTNALRLRANANISDAG
jgi:hypothetical protein